MELSIDIETYSSVDIQKCGLYKYVQSSDFQILLFAYAFDDSEIKIIDMLQGEKLPQEVIDALADDSIIKTAYNATFEWYAINKTMYSPLQQWRCTMVKGLYCGYPAGLSSISNAMGFPEDKKKMSAGRALIKKFCVPCNPTKSNGNKTRIYPKHEPEQWELFKKYCVQDVLVEREIKNVLKKIVFPEFEQNLWIVDQTLNANGIQIDIELVNGALDIHEQITDELVKEATAITGLSNPNSVSQLKQWLEKTTGLEIDSLNKSSVPEILEKADDLQVKRMLQIRQELSKTSIKKYDTMKNAVGCDNRVRGLLQYYGANRTGRWAGRLVQVQNLPRNYLNTLDIARLQVKKKSINNIKVLYGNVPDTLSQLIRTTFIPKDGYKFVVADYSAIEARVISWLAGENWRLDVFKTHGKIYEASASQMFGVEIDKIQKGNPEYALRQKGKVAELALGYQGGAGALIQMGALNMGLKEEELPEIVNRWRHTNKKIVDLWYLIENCAKQCVDKRACQGLQKGIVFSIDDNTLAVSLPSGRKLYYIDAKIEFQSCGSKLSYKGLNQTTKKWERIPTYGGKLTENIVQAIARDCLAFAIMNLAQNNYPSVMHIHDEVICEVPDNLDYSIDKAIEIMCLNPGWAKDLPLNADGFETYFYKKE